ncbi:MAG: hypothetical protein K2L86_01845 [Lachnospiraceae bacterium]|nr:hypothetical protein [Lachnospiraceae bacterium]
MNNTTLSRPGAVAMDFSAYAEPIASGISHCTLADHTYVIARKHPLADVNCPCYGIPRSGSPEALLFSVNNGDMHLVSAMINGSYDIKNCYSDNHDNCGLIYGLQGVCHQMANRILSTASQPNVLIMSNTDGSVKGLRLSVTIYGFYGRTRQSFAQRLFDITEATDAASIPSFKDFTDSILHKINCSAQISSETKEILREEITGISTPDSRLDIMCRHAFSDGLRKDQIKTLKDSLAVYTAFLDEETQKIDEYMKESINPDDKTIAEMLLSMLPGIERGFQQFNAAAFSILGEKNYEALYKQAYDENFSLYAQFGKAEL